MGNEYNQLQVSIDLQAVQANFMRICRCAACPVPVVKSDAYGHGLREVSRALSVVGAQTFATGTVGEAVMLKESLPQAEVISLLGPLDSADYRAVVEHDIVAFVFFTEQLVRLHEAAHSAGRISRVALKFDTGMSRLGFDASQAADVVRVLANLEQVRPELVCSHLATADDPSQEDYVREQARCFADIVHTLRTRGLHVRASLANSAAILAYPDLHYEMQRPGIALYGSNPLHGTAWAEHGHGLTPCMEVSTRLLQVRDISAGQSVSYGRTYKATRAQRIGIVALGYADNYSRGLSNTGEVLICGRRAPILGRVCMQLTAVDLEQIPEAGSGDKVFILGGPGPLSITAQDLATWWGTISYEVFCLLGQNQRIYEPNG